MQSIVAALNDKVPTETIFMHRGMRNWAPENTLEAFELAFKHGLHIETDVQVSSDGIPFLFHDFNLERQTGVVGSIKDMSSKDIEKLDAGYYSPLFRGRGHKLERLEMALNLYPDCYFSIDIKNNSRLAVDLVIKVIRKCQAIDRVMVGSFHSQVVEYLHNWYKKEIPTMTIMASPKNVLRYLISGGKSAKGDVLMVPNWLVKYIKLSRSKNARKLPIVSYTVNDMKTFNKMMGDYHVNGVVMEGAALT